MRRKSRADPYQTRHRVLLPARIVRIMPAQLLPQCRRHPVLQARNRRKQQRTDLMPMNGRMNNTLIQRGLMGRRIAQCIRDKCRQIQNRLGDFHVRRPVDGRGAGLR